MVVAYLMKKHVILFLLLAGLLTGIAQSAEKVTYIHNDALGSPVAATDESGNLLWKEDYKPYGERIRKETASHVNTLWYTGKPHEDEFGLSYFGARWYSPKMGRFTGIDPVGFNEGNFQSFNRYAYANNNPYTYIDPDGNVPIVAILLWLPDIGDAIGATAALVHGAVTGDSYIMASAGQGLGLAALGAVTGGAKIKALGGVANSGIINKGGRFADLDKTKGVGEVGHHMPQNAFNKSNGLSRSDGPAIGMTTQDHALTRTYAGKGKASMRQDAGHNARQRLAKDIHDLRSNFGTKYNKGSLEAIKYGKTLKEFQK